MARGDRRAERVRLEHKQAVNLMGLDGAWRRSCFLVDVSATGAKLEVEGSLDVLKAKQFFLLLSSTGLAFRRCELVRVDGSDVGVRFITDRETKGRPITPRWSIAPTRLRW
jgi:hypothetical protein